MAKQPCLRPEQIKITESAPLRAMQRAQSRRVA
ncbi:hypothetical protein GGI1_13269 [Acidithiobacillus sp. GGI-221]|nr:hypothetical protein GGI1_13269 [Acidithiobacillus sp. GGI-221]